MKKSNDIRTLVGIIPQPFRRRGVRVAATLLLRALLNLAGLAVLLPVLVLVLDPASLAGSGPLAWAYALTGIRSPQGFALAVCGAVVAVIVLKCAVNLLLARAERRYVYDLYRTLSRQLYVSYHDRGLGFVKRSNSAVLARNVNVVCLQFTAGVLRPAASIAAEAMLFLLLFGALALYAPTAALLAVAVFLPGTWLYYALVRNRIDRYGMEENRAQRVKSRIVAETFRGYADIEINDAFPQMLRTFDRAMDEVVRMRLHESALGILPAALTEIGLAAGMALLVAFGIAGATDMRLLFGVFAVAALRLMPSVRGMLGAWATIRYNRYAIGILRDGLAEAHPAGETAKPHPATPAGSETATAADRHTGRPEAADTAYPHADGAETAATANRHADGTETGAVKREIHGAVRKPSATGPARIFSATGTARRKGEAWPNPATGTDTKPAVVTASHPVDAGSPAEPASNPDTLSEKLPFEREIAVEGLSFRFEDEDRYLFRDLSLTIRKGERVGIRGVSGAGKTTLVNLLLGLYTPTEGRILIDGVPLTAANIRAWQNRIGYVSQNLFLCDGSFAENVALGTPSERIDRTRAAEALEAAQLGGFLAALPQGMDTPVGECGCRLSGGQRQRIGIARALYRRSDVLFFDEATSALDRRTEQEITRAITCLADKENGMTLLAIAHRESSLAFCQRILTIGKDEIHDNRNRG